MKFDLEIIKSFIKIPIHRETFFAFDKVYLSDDAKTIVVVFRSPFDEKQSILKSEYDLAVIMKSRHNNLSKLM